MSFGWNLWLWVQGFGCRILRRTHSERFDGLERGTKRIWGKSAVFQDEIVRLRSPFGMILLQVLLWPLIRTHTHGIRMVTWMIRNVWCPTSSSSSRSSWMWQPKRVNIMSLRWVFWFCKRKNPFRMPCNSCQISRWLLPRAWMKWKSP